MAFYGCGGKGSITEDGNDVYYPIVNPINENKAYNELYINEIAIAIDSEIPLMVSEMPEAIRALRKWGLIATNLDVTTVEYTKTPYPLES